MLITLTKRTLLRAALAAPAIISSPASAAFGRFMASSSQSGASGLVKPNGTPTMIENALSADMLIYAFDTGTGLYSLVKDCSPGHAINPTAYYGGASPTYWPAGPPQDPKQSLAPPVSTPYGDAIDWSALSRGEEKPGGGALIQLAGTDAVRTATNMAGRLAGAGSTFWATHRTTGQNRFGIIAGRYSNPDNLAYINCIYSANFMNSDYRIGFGWSSAPDSFHGQGIYSGTDFAAGLCTTVVTLENPSNFQTRIKMYVNGVLEADTDPFLQTVCDVAAADAYQEDQLQTGAGFHVFAGQSYNNYHGNVYQWGIANRAWSAADAISFAANPYQLLTF